MELDLRFEGPRWERMAQAVLTTVFAIIFAVPSLIFTLVFRVVFMPWRLLAILKDNIEGWIALFWWSHECITVNWKD